MNKIDITEWSDFVRGSIDPENRARLAARLDAGIPNSSKREIAVLTRLRSFAETEKQLEIPEHAIRCVMALGSLRRDPATTELSLLRRLAMSLRFDSLATAAVGVRDSRSAGHRQMIYEQAEFLVDLRIESDAQNALVVGQLMREGEEVVPLPDVPVLAVTGERIWARAQTGELGEFQTEGLPTHDVDLLILVDGPECLEIPLLGPAS